MNIIEKYIETNKTLLDDLVANDPTLGVGVIDALAVLNNYINANKIEFTEEEESKILIPANIEQIRKDEEKLQSEIERAKAESKEIQEVVDKVPTIEDNKNCTYFWSRDWLGNKENGYFVLGVTEGSDAIMFATYLAQDVFTNNPTDANKLVRNRISNMKLVGSSNGWYTLYLSEATTIKQLNAPKSVMSDYEVARTYSNATTRDKTPILIIDDERGDVTKILALNENKLGIDGYKVSYLVNTMMMVAWAEGIQMVDSFDDFRNLSQVISEAISGSRLDPARCYIILSRDDLSKDSELKLVFGSSLAEEYIKSKGRDNAFVVGILIDGALQDGIDPYMFAKASATISAPAPTPTPAQDEPKEVEVNTPVVEEVIIDDEDLKSIADEDFTFEEEELEDLDLSDLDFEIDEQE
jgi:hypothetical protein